MADSERALEELLVACFPELIEGLKKNIPRSLMMLGCLQQMERSLKLMNGHVYVSQWPNPDIVVLENTAYKVLMGHSPLIIYCSCSTENLKRTLEESRFNQLFTGKCTAEITGDPRCADIMLQNRRLNSCEVKVVALPYLCALTDPANLLKSECPSGFYIAPLRVTDAPLIDRMWKFGGRPRGVERFEKLIGHSLAAGVFSQDTQQLVTWAFVSEYGSLSFLHTLEACRRKGLAKALIYHLAKTLLNEGKVVFSVVEKENESSRQLFRKMGFTIFPDDLVSFLHKINRSEK